MRNLIDAITLVTESLQSFGVDTAGNSRFVLMKRLLKRGTVSPEDANFDVAREAIRDARIMEFFFDQFRDIEPTPKMIETLARAIADAPLPQDGNEETAGRDAQTELYVAAICSKAKLKPKFGEPDLIVTVDEQRVGMAVKRIKSVRQIEKHVRKAAKQIAKAGMAGHIILDVSLAFNPDNTRLVGVEDSAIQQAHIQARSYFADRYFSRIIEWTTNRPVISLILLDSLVRESPTDGWTLDSFSIFIPLDQSREALDRYGSFRRQFECGLATPPV